MLLATRRDRRAALRSLRKQFERAMVPFTTVDLLEDELWHDYDGDGPALLAALPWERRREFGAFVVALNDATRDPQLAGAIQKEPRLSHFVRFVANAFAA